MPRKRTIIATIFILFFLVVILAPTQEQSDSKIEQELKNVEPVNFRIVKIEDISFLNSIRYRVHIVVDEPATSKQLKWVAYQVVEQFKKERKFSGLELLLYDYEEYIGDMYTLGKVTFAPEGDIGKSIDVKVGDYDKMTYKFQIMEKNWSLRLTPYEVKVWKNFVETYDKMLANNPNEDIHVLESKVFEIVSKKFNITPNEVKRIIEKWSIWVNNDESKS